MLLALAQGQGVRADRRLPQGGLGVGPQGIPGATRGPDQLGDGFHPLLHQPVEAGQGPVHQLPAEGLAALEGIAAALRRRSPRHAGQQRPLQGGAASAQPQQVGHVHKAGGATADPVGVSRAEALFAGDDETALGGVVGQVGGPQPALPRQGAGLLEGEAIAAHQHLQPAVGAQADHHADPG